MSNSEKAEQEQRFIAILAKLEKIFELKAGLGQQLKQGYFHLAQAKYAAAPVAIGQASYGGNMQPLISISTSYEEDADSLYPRFTSQDAERAEGTEHSRKNDVGDAVDEDLSCLSKSSSKMNKDCSPSDQMPEASGSKSKHGSALQSQHSLLKMFGFLTPPALKQAQAAFSGTLPVVVQLANLQQELLELVDQFDEAAAGSE